MADDHGRVVRPACLLAAAGLVGSLWLHWMPYFSQEGQSLWSAFAEPVGGDGPSVTLAVTVALAIAPALAVAWRPALSRRLAPALAPCAIGFAGLVVRALLTDDGGDLAAGPGVALALLVGLALSTGRPRRSSSWVVALPAAVLLVCITQVGWGWGNDSGETVYILRGYGASSYAGIFSAAEPASTNVILAFVAAGVAIVALLADGPRAAWAAACACALAGLGVVVVLLWTDLDNGGGNVIDRLPGAWLPLGAMAGLAVVLLLRARTHVRPRPDLAGPDATPTIGDR